MTQRVLDPLVDANFTTPINELKWPYHGIILQRKEHDKGQRWLHNAPERKDAAKSYP
jgi:hypothetical protein